MTHLELIGTLASLVTLGELGYLIGKRRGRVADAEATLQHLSTILGSVTIEDVALSPPDVRPGGAVEVRVAVRNASAIQIPAWLGTTLVAPNRPEIFDPDQDKPIALRPGTHEYRRWLTVPGNASGEYSVIAGVWIGQVGSASNSVRVAVSDRSGRLRIGRPAGRSSR
jgi:hypothetical protein